MDEEKQEAMERWAMLRVDTLCNAARIAQNAARTAERDLEGIRCGRPTKACQDRYDDWKAQQ
jgi:hypothetical protein